MHDDGSLRVLLVEDEPVNRILVAAMIERSSDALGLVDLREAATLAEARLLLATEAFDVVLVDARLPDGNGLDLIPELRSRAPDPPRVAVVSASVLPGEQATALAHGADAFLGKPFSAAGLVALLDRLSQL